MQIITYQQALKSDSILFIDTRTAAEYNEATIPGAVNIPILNNEERKKVGTVYSQQSPAKAKKLAVKLVAPKIPQLIDQIQNLSQNYNKLLFFCSRGGLRSESLARFAQLAGLKKICKLAGGYKKYRRFILEQLKNYELPAKLIVLHGYTGVGKTELLYKLQDKGLKIIDLEGLANNRGSTFGAIGLGRPRNAKAFDSLLWEKLEEVRDDQSVFIEAESKRIGQAVLPQFLLDKKESGLQILIKSSIEKRCQRILAEYTSSYQKDPASFIKKITEAVKGIKKHLIQKLGKDGYQQLLISCKQADFTEVITTLFKNYYDPLYDYSIKNYDFDLIIKSDDLTEISQKLQHFVTNLDSQ